MLLSNRFRSWACPAIALAKAIPNVGLLPARLGTPAEPANNEIATAFDCLLNHRGPIFPPAVRCDFIPIHAWPEGNANHQPIARAGLRLDPFMKKCSYCGAEYPDDMTHCPLDQELLGESRFGKPVVVDKSPTAGFGIRALARILDMVFGLGIGLIAGVISGVVLEVLNNLGMFPSGWQDNLRSFSFMSILFAFFGNIAYHTFCEGIYGATPGKLACGLCVLSQDFQKPNLSGALTRSVAYLIDAIFFGVVGYNSMSKSPLNQRNGDILGRTIVVEVRKLPPESRPIPSLFIIGLLAGVGCDILLLVTGLVLKAL